MTISHLSLFPDLSITIYQGIYVGAFEMVLIVSQRFWGVLGVLWPPPGSLGLLGTPGSSPDLETNKKLPFEGGNYSKGLMRP